MKNSFAIIKGDGIIIAPYTVITNKRDQADQQQRRDKWARSQLEILVIIAEIVPIRCETQTIEVHRHFFGYFAHFLPSLRYNYRKIIAFKKLHPLPQLLSNRAHMVWYLLGRSQYAQLPDSGVHGDWWLQWFSLPLRLDYELFRWICLRFDGCRSVPHP